MRKQTRLTVRNPDGKTYRLPCVSDTENLKNQPGPGGYPTLFGTKIDTIGRMESIMPLEEWEKLIKKIRHMSLRKTCAGELSPTQIKYIFIIPCGRQIFKGKRRKSAVFLS